MPTINVNNTRSLSNVHDAWGWLAALGLVSVILGVMAIIYAFVASLVSVVLLGALLLAAGLIKTINAFRVRRWGGFFLNLTIGVLMLLAGLLIVLTPGLSLTTVTLVLAIYFVITGLMRIILASSNRFENWGWFLANGIVTLLLGGIIWLSWPLSSLYILGLLIGIDLIFLGALWLSLGMAARRSYA